MKKFGWILFYFFIFSILIYNSFSYLDPDFGWHLRFGQIIWKTLSLPHDQIFIWALEGKTWVDHEWLANLLLYIIWAIGGYIFVTITFAIIPVFTLFKINTYLFANYIKTVEGKIITAFFETLALLAMLPHLGIRIQETTLLATSLLLITLVSSLTNREKLIPWWLPIFFYFWACLHGGFFIGLVFLFFWMSSEILLYYFPSLQKFGVQPLSKKILQYSIIICGLSFIFTLLTPYGLTLYHFMFDYRDTFYQSHIQEWLSPFVFPFNYPQISLIVLVVISCIGTVFSLRKKIPLFIYIIVALLVFMAIKSVRHFPLLMVAWLILVFPFFIPELTQRIKFNFNKALSLLLLFVLLSVSIYLLILTKVTTKPFTSYCEIYPCGAALFLKNNPHYTKQLFNSYNFGGYLIGSSPELRLFIDGRLPQYPFNNHSILREYHFFFQPDYGRQKLNEHNISTVLLQKKQLKPTINWFEKFFLGYKPENFQTSNYLLAHVTSSSNWTKVYEDDVSIIFVKK